MKCFEIKKEAEFEKERFLLTVNMKCFEIELEENIKRMQED